MTRRKTNTATAVKQGLDDVGHSFREFHLSVVSALRGKAHPESALPMIKPFSKAMEDAWAAFEAEDYERVEVLIKVIGFMLERETRKFESDRKRWVERRLEMQQ